MDETHWRLFLALWPTAETREALVQASAGWRWPRTARRTRPERLHLTLHFLGEVAAERLPDLREGLDQPFEPFALELRACELWGAIAVLTTGRTPPELARLHANLAHALRTLGLPVEPRPFRPHVTLARQARGAVKPAEPAAVGWRAAEGYALVRSLPGGAGYQTVARYGCGSR